jgi:hypothetical protein
MQRVVCRISVLFLCLFLLMNQGASATSWVDIKPEEVVERADVVVRGTYDFSGKGERSEFIWTGYPFHITHIYKGDVPDRLIVGIDRFDVAWASDFQNKGGQFLLFLEHEKNADFLVPVAGPNGMIQLMNGEVRHHDADENAFFRDYLRQTKGTVPDIIDRKSGDATISLSHFLIVLAILFFLLAFLMYKRRKKRTV